MKVTRSNSTNPFDGVSMSDLPKDCGYKAILILGDLRFCCKRHKEMYKERARKRMGES